MSYLILKCGEKKPESEWERPGKPEWPDSVTVTMTKREAIRHLAHLAKQLESNVDEDDFRLSFVGRLTPAE